MSMLEKFKKAGGFLQLVQIVEICEPQKQKSMLHVVGSEDPGWAHLVRVKVLTLERILSWPPAYVMEAFYPLTSEETAALYQSIPPAQQDAITRALPLRAIREVQEKAAQEHYTSEQFFAAKIRLIQSSRECIVSGRLDFSSIDPSLIIEQKIAS